MHWFCGRAVAAPALPLHGHTHLLVDLLYLLELLVADTGRRPELQRVGADQRLPEASDHERLAFWVVGGDVDEGAAGVKVRCGCWPLHEQRQQRLDACPKRQEGIEPSRRRSVDAPRIRQLSLSEWRGEQGRKERHAVAGKGGGGGDRAPTSHGADGDLVIEAVDDEVPEHESDGLAAAHIGRSREQPAQLWQRAQGAECLLPRKREAQEGSGGDAGVECKQGGSRGRCLCARGCRWLNMRTCEAGCEDSAASAMPARASTAAAFKLEALDRCADQPTAAAFGAPLASVVDASAMSGWSAPASRNAWMFSSCGPSHRACMHSATLA